MKRYAIGLPPERGAQIREIAAALGMSQTDTVGRLLDLATDLGYAGAPGLRGLEATKAEGGVKIVVDPATFTLPRDKARELAAALATVANSGGKWTKFDGAAWIECWRTGRGVMLQIGGDVAARRSLGLSIAKRFAQSIKRAAE